MFEYQVLRDLLNDYEKELHMIDVRYEQLCDICLEDGLTAETDNEMDFIEDVLKILDESCEALENLLDFYNYR